MDVCHTTSLLDALGHSRGLLNEAKEVQVYTSDAHHRTGRFTNNAVCVSAQARVIRGAAANHDQIGVQAASGSAYGLGNVA